MTTTITHSEIENEFNITADFQGRVTLYVMSHEGVWTGSDTTYAGFRFRGSKAGSIDALSVSSTGTGGGGPGDLITIGDSSFVVGTGFIMEYTSTVGPVDVYRNAMGDLSPENFVLIASGETGGVLWIRIRTQRRIPKASTCSCRKGICLLPGRQGFPKVGVPTHPVAGRRPARVFPGR